MAQPNVLINIRADGKQAKAELTSLSRGFTQFGKTVRGIVSYTSQTATGIRQIAQGFQNLGFVLSAFVSLPVSRAFQSMSSEAIDFERAMVEVQKTTGLSSEAIKDLSGRVRELALQSPTSAVELANLASEAGRAGIAIDKILSGNIEGAIDDIIEFTRVVDMMVVSTTLSGEEASKAFGRFLAVFQDLPIENLENLGSAINELGQAASVNEQEIVGAMMRIAPAGNALGMTSQEVAALATTIVQLSESTSRGATRVRNALEQMAFKFDKAAQLMGTSAEELKDRLDENALAVFQDLLVELGRIESGVDRMRVSSETFGTTGSNAVMRLAESYPELVKYLAISNNAFEKGTSLQVEFNRAINSTKELLNIARNYFFEIGKTIASDVLPVFNNFIKAVLPAMLELRDIIAELSVKQKLLIVAIAGLLIVGLPVVALLGSFGFALSMVVNGIVNVIGGLVGLITTLGTLATGISIVKAALMIIVGALAGALVVAISKATGTFDMIIAKLREIAEVAGTWGGNIVAEIAGGMIQAATTVLVDALLFIANIIDNFLGAHSPPKKGPLASILDWGKNLIDTYLQGFLNADFSILKDVTNIIKSIFESMVIKGTLDEDQLAPSIMKVRTLVAQLIDTFNKTGVISEDILFKITKMLGEAGDEVAKLLKLQLKYNRAVRELDDIRRKMTDVEEIYQSEIRAIQNRTDLTEAEKMELIRAAKMRRNVELDNLETQESAAQKQVDALKEQVEWMKEYIDALMENDDIWEKQSKTIDKVVKALKSVAKGVQDALSKLLEQLAVNLQMQKLYEERGMDTKDLLREELSLRKRIVAEILAMKDPTADQLALLDENLSRIKELEGILDTTASKGLDIPALGDAISIDTASIEEQLNTVGESVKSFGDIMAEGKASWQAFKDGLSGKPISGFPLNLGALPDQVAEFYGYGAQIRAVWDNIADKWESIRSAWESFTEAINSGIDTISDKLQSTKLGEKFEGMSGMIVPALIASFVALKLFGGMLGRFFSLASAGALGKGLIKAFSSIFEGLTKLGGPALAAGRGVAGKVSEGIMAGFKAMSPAKLVPAIKGFFTAIKPSSIISAVKGLFETIILGAMDLKPGAIVAKLGGLLKGGVLGALSTLASGISSFVGGILGGITSLSSFIAMVTGIGGAIVAAGAIIASVVTYIIQHWEDFKGKFAGIFENVKNAISGFVDNFKKALGIADISGVKFTDILGYIYQKAEPIARFLSNVFVGAIQVVGEILESVLPAIGTLLGGVFRGIGAVAMGIIDVLSGVIEVIAGIWDAIKTGDTTRLTEGLKQLASGLLEILGGLATAIWGAISGVFDAVIDLADKLFPGIKDALANSKIVKWFSDVFGKVVDFFKGLYDDLIGNSIIPDIVNGIIEWINKLTAPFKAVFDAVARAMQPIVIMGNIVLKIIGLIADVFSAGMKEGGVAGGLKAVAEIMPSLLATLGPIVAKFGETLLKAGKSALSGLWSLIKAGFSALVESAKKFLTEKLPAIWEKLKSAFSNAAGVIWNWVKTEAVPAFLGFVNSVKDTIVENAPAWWEAIKSALISAALAIGEWAVNEGIPAIVGFVTGVGEKIKESAPEWKAKLLTALGTLAREISIWVTTKAVPEIRRFISEGGAKLVLIGTEWLNKARTALEKVRSKFSEIFGEIGDIIKAQIKAGINGMLSVVERGVNRVIDKINSLIEWINTALTALHLPTIKTMAKIRLPRLASGGIAMAPTLAIVGDVGGGEAIIPLDRLEGMLADFSGNNDGQNIEINIHNPVVRNDDDLNRIIEAVEMKLGARLDAKVRGLGRAYA